MFQSLANPTVSCNLFSDAFRQAIEQAGLVPPDAIIADGTLHRFSSNGDIDDNAGWYVLHHDAPPAGAFGCWRTGRNQKWCGTADATLTPAERARQLARLKGAQRQRERDEQLRHVETAKWAQVQWDQATAAPSDHPYLQRKQVQPHGLRVDADNRLIVPVRIDGVISSLQFIDADSEKKKLFLLGGKKRGGSYSLGDLTEATTILICEGYATGASLYEASGLPVVVAFDAGNLKPVALALRAAYPGSTLCLCADDDVNTKDNPGRTKATEVAGAVAGRLIVPDFGANRPEKVSDFNDLATLRGLDAVRVAIEAATRREKTSTRSVQAPLNSAGPSGPSGPSPIQAQSEPMDRSERSSGPEAVQYPQVSGYRISDAGVLEVPEDTSKPETRLTLAPCWILAHCRDGAKQNWGAYLHWVDRDQHVHEAAFPVGRFHESSGMLPVELANAGLPIVPGMERKLLRYLANGNPETRYRAATQTGWQDDISVFVLPSESLGNTKTQERVVYQPERYSPTSQSVRAKGSVDEWKNHVAGNCADNPILVFWLAASLAAPLLQLLGLEGGGFHLYGRTSQGKTTAEQVAASAWGDGSDPAGGRLTAFVKKWNLTKNATEGLAEAHNDLPLCLDEVGEADARDFGRTIYQLAGGQGKGRMRADATLKPSKAWRTLVLSTGEIPSAEVIESEGKHVKGGQAVRLVDIPATDPLTGEGIIVNTHGLSSPAMLADELKDACGMHYGWAGPAFVRGLIQEGLEAARKELRTTLDITVNALAPPGASPEVARGIKRFAVVAIAGEKAATMGILPWNNGEAVRSVRTILARHLNARGGSGSDTERAIESVKDFLLKHGASRFRNLDDEACRILNLAGYRDTSTGEFYFTNEGFKEACGGHALNDVARLLAAKGFLHSRDKGHLTGRISVPGVGRTRLYVISPEILDGEPLVPGPLDRSTG